MAEKMKNKRLKIVGVIGASSCCREIYNTAVELGKLLAKKNYAVVCGGLGGVMRAVCEGAYGAGGVTIGILPGKFASDANPFVTIPVVTAMSHARNAIIARTAEAVIAVGGRYGTLSEIALSLAAGKKVVSICPAWNIRGVVKADTPAEAVRIIGELFNSGN